MKSIPLPAGHFGAADRIRQALADMGATIIEGDYTSDVQFYLPVHGHKAPWPVLFRSYKTMALMGNTGIQTTTTAVELRYLGYDGGTIIMTLLDCDDEGEIDAKLADFQASIAAMQKEQEVASADA